MIHVIYLKVTINLFQAGVVPGAGNKIMVLGKKFDPMSDENYKQLITAENKAISFEQRVTEIAAQLTDIDNGHLEAKLHKQAFTDLQKRGNSLNEDMQKLLESLDAVTLLDDQQGIIIVCWLRCCVNGKWYKNAFNILEAKAKRKSVATRLNKVMDKNDTNMEKIRELLAKG